MLAEAIARVLSVILPGLFETIAAALKGDDDARKRLSMVLPERSRSNLERELDQAAIDLAAKSFDT